MSDQASQYQQAALAPQVPVAVLQRQCACGQHTHGAGECQACQKKRTQLQRAGSRPAPAVAPPSVQDVLNSPGHPLDAATRAFMEPRFERDFSRTPLQASLSQRGTARLSIGAADDAYEREAQSVAEHLDRPDPETLAPRMDFSQVRIHTDARAAESARAVNAMAYTVGRDVVFGARQYAPLSHLGRKLIAHELAHVVQQSGAEGIRADQSIQRQPEKRQPIAAGPEQRQPIAAGSETAAAETGHVSVYTGKTMTSEAALRQIYRQSAHEISEYALRMVAQGTSVEEAARWAAQARNDLKVLIRARGSPIIRGFAEARNIRKYGDKVGPTYEELIREGKTPEDIIGSAGKASERVNRVGARVKVGGRFLIAIDLAIVTWEVISAPEGERLRAAVGGAAGVAGAAAGGWAGAKGGAVVGGFFGGPIGAGIGGIIGGIGGAIFGGWLGHKAGEKVYDLVDDLVNPPSGSTWELEMMVIDGIQNELIRSRAQPHP